MLLDHHHRAVDDEAEVDGAEAHQVAGDAEHAPCATVAPSIDSGMATATSRPARRLPSSGKQHADDQQAALEQVLADRPQRVVNEHAAVVDDVHADVRAAARPATAGIRLWMAVITSRAFAPRSIWAMR